MSLFCVCLPDSLAIPVPSKIPVASKHSRTDSGVEVILVFKSFVCAKSLSIEGDRKLSDHEMQEVDLSNFALSFSETAFKVVLFAFVPWEEAGPSSGAPLLEFENAVPVITMPFGLDVE